MKKSMITKVRQTFTNAGSASPLEKLSGLKLKLMSLFIILTFASGCSEFALLASAGSVAASQNAYTKAYGAIDFGVVITTDQDIKTHAYEKAKKLIYDKRR